ncbi:hypothetical protein ACOBR2_06440 [Telmatobacter bradus]|uniref:hypothetical protein n=1 Tax=Telmatobacter bradus TaxID=474953 RepID=UPI003B42C233
MAKAVTEIALGAAAVGASFAVPGSGVAIMGTTMSKAALTGILTSFGASMLMGGAADAMKALDQHAGIATQCKSPTGPHCIIYGWALVGGTKVYITENSNVGNATTSNNKQLHQVSVLASHPCALDKGYSLWANQKAITITPATYGYGYSSCSPTQITSNISSLSVTNGVAEIVLESGDSELDGQLIQVKNCSPNTLNGKFIFTQGADDCHYSYTCGVTDSTATSLGCITTTFPDYSNKIFFHILDGTNTSTFPLLLSAGTDWNSSCVGYGYTTVYVQCGYDSSYFSALPNLQFLLYGKNTLIDPRTGSLVSTANGVSSFFYGWSDNPAVCIMDYLMTPRERGGFGLTASQIDKTSFSTAANVCDEVVSLADGGTERTYTLNGCFMLTETRGSILNKMLSSCAGRITLNGGKFGLQVGVAQTPTLTITPDWLVGGVTYRPKTTLTSLFNAVKGTYASPENLYMPSDFPAYLQDTEHGYSTDQYLVQDGNERIYAEIDLPFTQSASMAQRLAKIHLMRTRFQERLSLTTDVRGYQLTAGDWVYVNIPRYGLTEHMFEVQESSLEIQGKALVCRLELKEVDDSIFSWSTSEELTPQGYSYPSSSPLINDPTGLLVYSGSGNSSEGLPNTITTNADGSISISLYVQWDAITDSDIESMQVQYMLSGGSSWTALSDVNISASSVLIGGATAGATYLVRIRCKSYSGVYSDWVENAGSEVCDAYGASATSMNPLASGCLIVIASSDGTACAYLSSPITFTINGNSFSIVPEYTYFSGLAQSTVYYAFYCDPTFANITPNVQLTTSPSTFQGKAGYFYLACVTTPSYSTRYQPTEYYNDMMMATGGTRQATVNPTYAYDNNLGTCAVVGGTVYSSSSSSGSAT